MNKLFSISIVLISFVTGCGASREEARARFASDYSPSSSRSSVASSSDDRVTYDMPSDWMESPTTMGAPDGADGIVCIVPRDYKRHNNTEMCLSRDNGSVANAASSAKSAASDANCTPDRDFTEAGVRVLSFVGCQYDSRQAVMIVDANGETYRIDAHWPKGKDFSGDLKDFLGSLKVKAKAKAKVEVEIAHISEDEANAILNGEDDDDDWQDHLPSSKHLPISYEAPAGWKSEGARSCDANSIDTFVKDGNVIVLESADMKPDADAGYVNILVAAFKHDGCEGGYNDLKVDEGMVLGTQVCGERVMSVVHFTFYGENYAIRGNVPRDQLSELTAATSAILASFKQSKEGTEVGSGFDESCY